MKLQHLFIEYILLFFISITAFYMIYSWYIDHKLYYINIINNKNYQNNVENFAITLYNLQGVYYYNLSLNYNFNAECLYNYTLVYYGNCDGYPYNMPFQGYLIYLNNSYFLYSNITNEYYLMVPYKEILLQGCYLHYVAYLINSTYCYGICQNDCNILLQKQGNKLKVYLR